jgi:hypothetical protein
MVKNMVFGIPGHPETQRTPFFVFSFQRIIFIGIELASETLWNIQEQLKAK